MNVDRHARQIVLPEIGGPGQAALAEARIAIVGCGGLGGPAAMYLAAAGIGHLTLIDDDAVELSNLQRQVQFGTKDIGSSKVGRLGERVEDIDPATGIRVLAERLTDRNAADRLSGHDVIMDGTDSFRTRFAVNAAALAHGTPLVSGALGRFDGQVGVFAAPGPCYRCFVPDIPPDAPTCAQVGVVGALAGVIGSVMALETIKLITGAGRPLLGRLWLYDGLAATARTVYLARDPACPACR